MASGRINIKYCRLITLMEDALPQIRGYSLHVMNSIFLPPPKEFWGKIIFSQEYISHSLRSGGRGGGVGALCMMSFPVWLPGHKFLLGWSLSRGSLSIRGLCPGGSLSMRVSVRGVSARWSVSGGSLSRKSCEERVVRILLECFLVLKILGLF